MDLTPAVRSWTSPSLVWLRPAVHLNTSSVPAEPLVNEDQLAECFIALQEQ
jgi:hypothetical protein